MPGQRKKSKRRIAVWLLPEERKKLETIVGEMGIDMSEFVKLAIKEAAKKKGLSTDEGHK